LSSVPEGVNKLKSLRKLKDKENGNYPATWLSQHLKSVLYL
jgi:hypothetical protein